MGVQTLPHTAQAQTQLLCLLDTACQRPLPAYDPALRSSPPCLCLAAEAALLRSQLEANEAALAAARAGPQTTSDPGSPHHSHIPSVRGRRGALDTDMPSAPGELRNQVRSYVVLV